MSPDQKSSIRVCKNKSDKVQLVKTVNTKNENQEKLGVGKKAVEIKNIKNISKLDHQTTNFFDSSAIIHFENEMALEANSVLSGPSERNETYKENDENQSPEIITENKSEKIQLLLCNNNNSTIKHENEADQESNYFEENTNNKTTSYKNSNDLKKQIGNNKRKYSEDQFSDITEKTSDKIQLLNNNNANTECEKGTEEETNYFTEKNINKKMTYMQRIFPKKTIENSKKTYSEEQFSDFTEETSEKLPKSNNSSTDNKRKSYPKKNYPKKQTYCVFCKQLKTNISRHYEIVHHNEEQVQEFLLLEKNSKERNMLISVLRDKGNFEYNIDNSEKPIVKRRRHKLNPPEDIKNYYLPCPNCTAFFSHQNLARHYNKCTEVPKQLVQKPRTRSLKRNARTVVTRIHKIANNVLKRKIIPPMRRDAIFETMRKDKLILLYGNHLTAKFTGHQEYMIRNHMRFLTRYFLTVKELCPKITNFSMLFKPKHFDVVMQAILKLAGLNEDTGKYKSPKSALQLVHNLKVCCNVLQSQYIKEENQDSQKRVQRFAKLLSTDAPGQINKPAFKSLIDNKRKKLNLNQIKMPLSEDISKFKSFLIEKCDTTYRSLIIEGFSYQLWKRLAELLLLYIVVFNRKRSGEAHKILVEDFLSKHQLSNTALPEIYEALNEADKNMANYFYKIVVRGKLDSAVTIFIPGKINLYLDYIHSHREDADVPKNNPYLFGLPGKLSGERYRLLETCSLMRKYTELANLQNPKYMRTTLLRKHLATRVSALNLEDAKQKTVIDFMGHQEHIHKRFYRQEVVTKDLTMTQILDQDMNGSASAACAQSENSVRNQSEPKQIESVSNSEQNGKQLLAENDDVDQSTNYGDTYTKIHHVTPTKRLRNSTNVKKATFDNKLSMEPYSDSGSSYNIGSETSDDSKGGYKKNKAKRKLCSRASTTKITWSTPERQTARRLLNSYVQNHSAPSEEFCQSIVNQEPILSNRTPQQLKAWVYNQIKKVHYRDTKPRMRATWTTPQKRIMREAFGNYIKNAKYPSHIECKEVISQHPELQEKSVAQLKSFIQHANKKLFN